MVLRLRQHNIGYMADSQSLTKMCSQQFDMKHWNGLKLKKERMEFKIHV